MPIVGKVEKHIVALSVGKDSTVMALRLNEVSPRNYEYVCTPTGDELPEMVEHWTNLGERLGKPLTSLTDGRTLGGLIVLQNCLPNFRMRWCTRLLKIEPFETYVLANRPCTVYVGIRADETDREGVKYEDLGNGIKRVYPLVDWNWGLGDVKKYLKDHDIHIPERTDCASCFFQTLYEWWLLWKNHPERYARAEAWEKHVGHTLRSETRDTWPAALSELRKRFESGDVPKDRRKMDGRSVMCSTCSR